jgi:hypothetical protein
MYEEIKSRLKMEICAVIPVRFCCLPISYLETKLKVKFSLEQAMEGPEGD